MERIFVNDRRSDSPGHAGRLYDHLVSHFGEKSVFRDIEAIQFGADLVVSIEDAISQCGALLVVIGPIGSTPATTRDSRRALSGMSALRVIAVARVALVFLNGRGKTPPEPTSPPSETPPSQEPAWAEANPSCESVTQIGTTEHIKVGGTTFGSVKQFKGCGKNWGYVFVWASWREAHRDWTACAEVLVQVPAGPGESNDDPRGTKCASNQVEVWSDGTDTLQNCTRAAGYPRGAKELSAVTSQRC